MVPPTSSTFDQPAVEPISIVSAVKLALRVLVRRRILLTAVLFGLLIAFDVWRGHKPLDLLDVRNPVVLTGYVLIAAGLALRSWAVGILHKNRKLTMTGPYRLIRNPLYVGSFLMMFGFCTLINDLANFLVVLGPMLVIYILKVRHEERNLADLFPAEWPAYQRGTPRFVPRVTRADLSADWRASQWLDAREYQAGAATLLALVLIQVWRVYL